ncbi:MAG: TPM domain-containing protein [Bacteroidota bacterium]|nr:TPM domain-containing protein [Bacteroidota bacterium]MDQ6889473.1 TPM domain-containing protein [Bacteroidota bacterium]
MWPFTRKKDFFSKEENELIVQSIRDAEKETSGEVRIYVESRCKYLDALDRAKEIFSLLKMENTKDRNGVLFYVALKDRQLAIFADTGIHTAIGEQYWKDVVAHILLFFNKENYALGIKECILKIGQALKSHFPYDQETDKNELPDEIIFGR